MNAEVEGFAQFVAVRQRALQRTAWLLTGDWALAEDLVQTALVRSWPRWERIRRRDAGPGRDCPDLAARHAGQQTMQWPRRTYQK